MRWPAVFLVTTCLIATARMAAQDVVVGPPAWWDESDPPDTLPALRPVHPEFPSELEKTPDIGWAMITYFVDEHGRVLTREVIGTQPAYREAADRGDRSFRELKPAQRGGQPVNSRIRITIAFNPRSAGLRGPDATPRLLNAAPVIDPARVAAPDGPSPRPETVWAKLKVDEQGEVTAVSDAPAALLPLLSAAARKWRFAPARKAGRPTAAEVRAPFIVLAPESREQPKDMVPPLPVTRVEPDYPRLMNVNGLRGEVTVEFVVDIEGRPRALHVVATLNPAFDEAALTAIKKWKFRPALAHGVPVAAQVRQTFAFNFEDGSGSDGFEVKNRAKQSKLPETLRYDTAPKIEAFVMPVYPLGLLRSRKRGSAHVSAVVNASGDVVATKVVGADRPEFGLALQAAMERFHYSPALRNGQPVETVIGFEQEFDPWDDRMVSEEDRAALRLEEEHPERIAKAADLDRKLKVIHAEPPHYPASLAERTDGSAKVEFMADGTGHVRIPRILSASRVEMGYAAVQAVSAWLFEPPTSHGKPVTVRVAVPIDFHVGPPPQSGDRPAARTH